MTARDGQDKMIRVKNLHTTPFLYEHYSLNQGTLPATTDPSIHRVLAPIHIGLTNSR
jgi:hypothetical protein